MKKPVIAVWKFSSCDGCQLSLLDCEDEILAVAGAVEIGYFMEASKREHPGPYDLSIVEGSITTPEEKQRIRRVRAQSKFVLVIGACATSGGIQALRNFADVKEYTSLVYASPEYIDTLEHSTPISDHVHVDFELRGCPINKKQLLEVVASFVHGKQPNIPDQSVCVDCKLKGNVCIMVSTGAPCLGPVTHAGCEALCPSYHRGCYGCYGPRENSNMESLGSWMLNHGLTSRELIRKFSTFNANATENREARSKL